MSGAESVPSPIFVCCPPRSCSTVVTAMLGCHPELYAFPELVLFTADTVGDIVGRHEADWENYHRSGLLRAVAELEFGAQTPTAVAAAERWLIERSGWPPATLFEYLLAIVAPNTGVEKSPDTVLGATELQRCLDGFPDGRLFHLARHPVPMVESFIRHRRVARKGTPTHVLAAAGVRSWLLTHTLMLAMASRVEASRLWRAQAEAILADPRTNLSAFCRWAGVSADESSVERMCHPENWSYAGFGPSDAPGGGDWNFFRAPQLRSVDLAVLPSLASPPSEWAISPAVWDRVTEIAHSLGY